MTVEAVPDISDGVMLAAYIAAVPIDFRYVLCDVNGAISGVSKGFCDYFGVPPTYS